MRILSAIVGASLVLCAAPALAEPEFQRGPTVHAPAPAAAWPNNPDQLGGTWTLDGLTEGADSCSFQLSVYETIGGWTLNFPPSCKREFPVGDITAWHVNPENGNIVFSNAERRTVFEFERTADGAYVAHPEGQEGMVIAKGDPADQRAPTPQEAMTGVWRISALGVAPLCSFNLTSDTRGRSGTMAVRPGCGTEWANRGWARWTLNGKTISLQDARGREIISFRQLELFTFEKRASDDPYSQRGEIMFFGKVFD